MMNERYEEINTAIDEANRAFANNISSGISPSRSRSLRKRREDDDNEDYQDAHFDMTRGRRIAMRLRKRKFYNPNYLDHSENTPKRSLPPSSSQPETATISISDHHNNKPSLKSAWEYFEHKVLPRYVDYYFDDDFEEKYGCFSEYTLERAKPSETRPTKLYPIVWTGTSQLNGFGIGMFLYFLNLKFLVALTMLAGLLNVNTLQFFSSGLYDPAPSKQYSWILKRSAVCTNQVWVPCQTCTSANFSSELEKKRYAYTDINNDFFSDSIADERQRINSVKDGFEKQVRLSDFGISNGNITLDTLSIQPSNTSILYFGLKNDCGGEFFIVGMVTFSTVILMTFGIWYINYELNESAVLYDEDEQTAQDYSIIIKNPPFDAHEPEEWRVFFSNFDNARVTCCSINIDNKLLVNSLLERRERLKQIELILPPGTPLDDKNLARLAAELEESRSFFSQIISIFCHPFGLLYDVPALYAKVVVLTAKIKGISQRNYRVKSVYISFETEKDQRFVRAALSVPKLSTMLNTGLNNKNYMFRGALVLDIEEAPEPETIHWQHMNTNICDNIKATLVIYILSFFIIVGIFLIITTVNESHPKFLAPVITAMNLLFPFFARWCTRYEKHGTETEVQASLYIKTMIFRLVNTVVVLYITEDFTATTDENGLIESVVSIFFSEIITVNLLNISDPWEHFRRHYLGPRQKTQDRMNRCFQGSRAELAERYTTSAKLIILCATYFVLYPSSLFLCSLALFVNYNVDKFCLLRTWAPIRRLEAATLKMHAKVFTPVLIFTLSFCSCYWWSGFPFDNICGENEAIDSKFVGTHTIKIGNGKTTQVTIDEGDKTFQFCNQDMLSRLVNRNTGRGFPPFPEYQGVKWMTEEQEKVVTIFCWLLVAMIVISGTYLIYSIITTIQSFFHAAKPIGDDQGIPFSSVPSITTYIPEVNSREFSYPLLICNIDEIDHSLISWKDPRKPYDFYNLINDAKEILGVEIENDGGNNCVFDRVKHWPVDIYSN